MSSKPDKASTKNWLDDESSGDSDNEEFGLERTEAAVAQTKVDSTPRAYVKKEQPAIVSIQEAPPIQRKDIIARPPVIQEEQVTQQDLPEVEAAAKLHPQENNADGGPERRPNNQPAKREENDDRGFGGNARDVKGEQPKERREYVERGDKPFREPRQNNRGDLNKDNNREPRKQRGEQREKQQNINPNSNFRLWYVNDPQFYELVIRKEEPPYEFKIHLFLTRTDENKMSPREITLAVMQKLNEYGAQNVIDHLMIMDKQRDSYQNNKNDKIRYNFVINDRDQALACYRYFSDYNRKLKSQEKGTNQEEEKDSFNLQEQMKIYLQRDEAVFEEYANEEAALYEQMKMLEQMQQKTQPAQPRDERKQRQTDKRPERGGGDRRNGNDRRQQNYEQDPQQVKEEAEKMGVKFGQGGPPRFKNDKKKETDLKKEAEQKDDNTNARQVIEEKDPVDNKNLREIINLEKQKSQESKKYNKDDNRGHGQPRERGGYNQRGGDRGERRVYQKRNTDQPNEIPHDQKFEGQRDYNQDPNSENPKQQNHTYKIRSERGRGGNHHPRGGDREQRPDRPQTQQYVARKSIKDEDNKQVEDDYGVEEVKGHQGQQREVVDTTANTNNRSRGGGNRDNKQYYQKKQYGNRDDNQEGGYPQQQQYQDKRPQYQPRSDQEQHPRGGQQSSRGNYKYRERGEGGQGGHGENKQHHEKKSYQPRNYNDGEQPPKKNYRQHNNDQQRQQPPKEGGYENKKQQKKLDGQSALQDKKEKSNRFAAMKDGF